MQCTYTYYYGRLLFKLIVFWHSRHREQVGNYMHANNSSGPKHHMVGSCNIVSSSQ